MADKKFKLDLEIATKQAQAGLKDAAKEAKKLGSELDDTRSAGNKFADAMDMVTDDLAADLKRSEKAADSLGKALGPEMVADIRAQGRSVGDLVQDLKRAGLTYEDVEQDAEALARAMKRANDVGKEIDGHITRPIQDLGRESDNSRSVLANMVGNSAQDLGNLGGVAGTAGVAIGQLAEYAADGNISLAGLAKFAGPMALVGVGVSLISGYMENIAKSKAFNADRVKKFSAALQEGATAAEAWNEALSPEDPKLEFINAATGDVQDLTHVLYKNRVTFDEFSSQLNGSKEEFEAWARSVFSGAEGSKDLNWVLQAGWQLMDQMGTSMRNTTEDAYVYGKATKEAGDETRTTADEVRTLNDSFGMLLDTLNDEDAFDTVLDGFDDIDQAAKDAYEAAATGAEDAASKLRDYEGAIRDQKREVIDYADELGNVPKDVVSTVIAMLDRGEFDKAKTEVQRWADTPAYKKVIVATSQQRGSKDTGFNYAVGTSHARGGISLVGETGPELVEMPAGSKVTGSVQTENMLNRASGSTYVDSRTFNIVIPNQTPEATAAEIAKYNRRNGLS